MTRRGALSLAGGAVPCLVQNLSSGGFLIMCTKEVSVGQILELKCELYPDRFLQCKVEVRHVHEEFVGAKIVEVNEAVMKLCRQYLEEYYSEHLGKFG